MTQRYDPSRTLFGLGQLNWLSQTHVLTLVSEAYVFDAGHTSLLDVPTTARRATSSVMIDKTLIDGFCSSSAVEISTAGLEGTAVGAILHVQALGDNSSILLAYYDPDTLFPLDLGAYLLIAPDAASGGWFQL